MNELQEETGMVKRKRAREVPSGPRLSGVLVRIKSEQGYGFLRADNGGREYFVHVSALHDRDHWVEGHRFSFIAGEPIPGSRQAPQAFGLESEGEK